MALIPSSIERYLEDLVPERPASARAMERRAARTGFPIIGPACGHACYQLARMIGARSVFELGSGFGYSTAFFAAAVRDNGGGLVHHSVWDEQLSADARGSLSALGLASFVRFHVGESIAALEGTDGPFDAVFLDIDKHAYPRALAPIAGRLAAGGLLLVDNALWHGRVLDTESTDADTAGVRALTDRLTGEPGWITSVVPIRDGLLVAYRDA